MGYNACKSTEQALPSRADCQLRCLAMPSCKAFEWQAARKMCWLKSTVAGTAGQKAVADHEYGVLSCPAPPVCQDGDVRIPGKKGWTFLDYDVDLYPEISFDGSWYPICGHHFWDSDDGAALVCRKLGFETGKRSNSVWNKVWVAKDAMPVGKCEATDDSLMTCRGGSNYFGDVGGRKEAAQRASCKRGEKVWPAIRCYGGAPPRFGNPDPAFRSSCSIQTWAGDKELALVSTNAGEWSST